MAFTPHNRSRPGGTDLTTGEITRANGAGARPAEVFDSPASPASEQAENPEHTIKAILLATPGA